MTDTLPRLLALSAAHAAAEAAYADTMPGTRNRMAAHEALDDAEAALQQLLWRKRAELLSALRTMASLEAMIADGLFVRLCKTSDGRTEAASQAPGVRLAFFAGATLAEAVAELCGPAAGKRGEE